MTDQPDSWRGLGIFIRKRNRSKLLTGLATVVAVLVMLYIGATYNMPIMVLNIYKGVDKVEQEIIRRRIYLQDVCHRDNIQTDTLITRTSYMVRRHDFSICRVAKIGSTFWVRFLYQMVHTSPIESPFYAQGILAYDFAPKLRIKPKEVEDFRRTKTRVVFVREPYSRLFSAYIDKLFQPNLIYWKLWGIPATVQFRQGVDVNRQLCGSDVSFPEFISLATSALYKSDNHVCPVSTLCSPCQNNYTVIGKMESFQKDATYIASLLGVSEEQLRFDKMTEDLAVDALNESVHVGLESSKFDRVLKCITLEAVVQRIWRKNQIRGFISWRQHLRLTETQKTNIGIKELQAMLHKARALSTNATELRMQKKQALAEAFSLLSTSGFAEIQRVFRNDFKLFGYSQDLAPRIVEDLSEGKRRGVLDYSKDWDLSGL